MTADLVDHFARQAGRIDLRTLEILVPIGGFADQPALHIFLPERSPPIHTESIEAERIERQLGGEIERGVHIFDRFIGVAHGEKAVHDLDAGLLGVLDRGGHFLQRLFLLEPIENLLAAAFNPEHDRPAMGLGHGGKQMLRNRVHPPFDAPLDRELLIHHTLANRLDPLGLQQEMVVDEIDRSIAAFFEILEFAHHMRRQSARATCLR